MCICWWMNCVKLLLLQLVDETSSLCQSMFRSLVHIIIQSASGPVNIWYVERIFSFLTVTVQLINLEGIRNLESVNHHRCHFIPVRNKKRGLAVFIPRCVSEPARYWSVCVMYFVCTLSLCFLYQCEKQIKVRGKMFLNQ